MDKIIELKNISFRYNEKNDVLKNISFSICKGEHISIIGHNGSGKSTLAKILAGLLTINSGEIILNNEKITEKNIQKLNDFSGIVFQNPDNQFIGATVEDDIVFGLENKNVELQEMKKIVYKVSKLVNMEDHLKSSPSELSGGQKQRVAIAGILALNPSLYIFDEATSMLDPEGVKEINKVINELKKENNNLAFVSITHNVEESLNADKIIVLNKGEIYKIGTPSEIFTDENLINLGINIPNIFRIKNSLSLKGNNEEEIIGELCK